MKHTKTISLVLIASMVATTLTACSQPEDFKRPPNLSNEKIYSSVEQCKKDKVENCELHYKNATTNHLLRAPRYTTESQCKNNGHEKCVGVNLEDSTVWLPKMVGFMKNDRPIYLKKLSKSKVTVQVEDDDGFIWEEERSLTAAELKEREIVAGPSNSNERYVDNNSIVIVGGWYPSPMYYSHGFSAGYNSALYDGMRESHYRATGSRSFNTQTAPRVSNSIRTSSFGRTSSVRSTSVRGGFGRAGGGFSSGG